MGVPQVAHRRKGAGAVVLVAGLVALSIVGWKSRTRCVELRCCRDEGRSATELSEVLVVRYECSLGDELKATF